MLNALPANRALLPRTLAGAATMRIDKAVVAHGSDAAIRIINPLHSNSPLSPISSPVDNVIVRH